MGVRYRCHSPVPSGQSVRKLSEIPTLGSDRSGVGATLDLPFFRRNGLPVRLIRSKRGWMLSCVRGRDWLSPLLSSLLSAWWYRSGRDLFVGVDGLGWSRRTGFLLDLDRAPDRHRYLLTSTMYGKRSGAALGRPFSDPLIRSKIPSVQCRP